jgi:lysophospholipase L1-like esterase
LLVFTSPVQARPHEGKTEHWVSAWGSAQMVPDTNNALTPEQWRDTSLRQIVRLSLPAHTLRIRVSNVFGTAPLLLSSASVGLARQLGTPDLQPGTAHPLRFNGETTVRIPAGGEYLSDPVEMKVSAGADLAVSMHFLGEPSRQTGHPGSRSNSFIVSGDQVMAEQWTAAQMVTRWYSLADVEVMAPRKVGAVVAVGDSITDGYGVKPDANTRWTDFLFQRMQREHAAPMGIVNVGIGGGRLLQDGLGPNLVSRFERDVLGRTGVTHAILLIGVNDFGVPIRNNENSPEQRAQLLADIKLGMKQLVERSHAHGICLIGGTMTPYKASDYYHPTDLNEADRQDLNAWIRNSKTFDAVADFDAATRDADHPELFAKSAETLDGLHPGVGGQRLIAEAVPLKALRTCKWNNRP